MKSTRFWITAIFGFITLLLCGLFAYFNYRNKFEINFTTSGAFIGATTLQILAYLWAETHRPSDMIKEEQNKMRVECQAKTQPTEPAVVQPTAEQPK